MADIFVSYTRADREKVRPIVELLSTQGWRVWWDRDIPGGERWDAYLERELTTAGCVLVVWSPVSVEQPYVREEASFAREEKKLLPVTIDGIKPPVGFRNIQTVNFTPWNGGAEQPPAIQLIQDWRGRL